MLYIDKSASKPMWAHEFNRDEGARAFQDAFSKPFHADAPLYNRNQDSAALEDVRRWDDYYRARPGTGKRVSAGGVNIIFSDSNTHYRGDNNYRRSGEVDAMRLPKEGFFADQVMWDGWVDPERVRVHVLGHWNYDPGTMKPVYVVSSAEKVELLLNGRSLGVTGPEHDFIFTFPAVRFEPGVLQAVALDASGRRLAEDRVVTVGKAVAIRLTAHTAPDGLRADGSDMALIDAEVVDGEGRRCPTAIAHIHFELEGPAEWRGGIAQGTAQPAAPGPEGTPLLHDDNFILSRDLPVEAGINRVALRATRLPGRIHVVASSEGLRTAEILLDSAAVTVEKGLAREFQATELPLNLERGPTPSTPSFHARRIPIEVKSATAGANPEDAAKSIDDNESTWWTNENAKSAATLEDAWIEYRFARPEKVAEVEFKFTGFRNRIYPIRIEVDGREVWRGTTDSTLGYWHLTLPDVAEGSSLRVALTAPPVDRTQNEKELNGKTDPSGNVPLGTARQPVLSIVEAEFYGTK